MDTKDKKLELVCIRNPFDRMDRDITSVTYDNQSLAGILQQYIPKDAKVAVSISGKLIPEDIRHLTYPQIGEQIIVIPLVTGGDDDKAILAIVLMIAVAWAAPALVAGLPGALTAAGELTFLGTLYAAGVMVAGGMLINSLMPTPQAKQPGYDVSQIYGWSPQTTQQQGLVVPKFYGKNKHFTNIFAVHTDVSGDGEKQTLKFAAGLGVGPIKSISNKKLNDQPIGNYSDVTSEDRLGLIDQTVTTIFGDTKVEYVPNIKVTNSGGAKTYVIPDDDYDDIEVTIFFSRGVYWANDQGGLSNHSVGIKVEISESGAGSWTIIGEETVTRNDTSRFWKTYKASDSMAITNGTKYDVRVTKTTSDEGSMRYGDDLYLSSVREVLNDDFQYPKTAYVAVSALATDQLSGSLRFSCETEDAIVDTYNGSSWTLQWSDNPAWALYDILTQPVISGDGGGTPYAVERYDGINPSRLDYAMFYELAQFCDTMVPDGSGGTEKRITFNAGFDTPTTMWEAALKVCEIARCALVWNGINITLAIDKAGDAVQMFSVGNIIKDTFKETFLPEKDRASEIELRYIDADLGFKLTPFTIFNTAINNPTNKVTLELFGITRQSEAWRAGMYRLAQNEYLKTVVDFEADIDSIACTLGDIIYVQHDVPQWGEGGRISSATDSTITIHKKLSPTSGVDQIMVRDPSDDTMETKTVVGIVNNGNWSTLTISGTWTRNPIKDDLFAYGIQNLITKKFRIIDLRRSGDQQCAIKALQNDPEVYTPDGSEPVLPALNVTPSESDAIIRPPNWEDMVYRIPQTVLQGINVDIPLITNLTWNDNTPGAGSVSWSATDGTNPILFTYKGITYEITAGNTNNEFVYWDLAASTVFSSSANGADMIGVNKWPVCINDSGTASRVVSIPVLHGGIIRAGTIIASTLYVVGLDSNGQLKLGEIGSGDASDVPGAATADQIALIKASLLANWRLDIADLAGRPAGIYPVESINDFDQIDWLDSGEAEIKILSTPDTTVSYGFPAIPIDDKQKYAIIIHHKSSAASADGLYLRLNEYNAALPVGKTHIGLATGGANVEVRTGYVNLIADGAMPGTSWVVNEYTYTPTAGTKYASFAMMHWNPATAGVEYHVDYVLMYVIPKTAAEIAETGSRKWAAEPGADITGDHEGDISIENITDGTVYKKYLNTEKTKLTGVETGAEVNPADLAALDSAQDTKLTGIETSATTDQTGAEIKTAYEVEANAYTDTKNTKLGGVESLADVTAEHADDIIYRGNTPPAHKVGRVWYCLVNGSYDNYTLYRSTGAAWVVISDTTAQHQADVQLANLGEKSLNSLTDKSLANLDSGANTKLGGIETSADVTNAHQGDVNLANLGEKSVDSLVDGTYAKMLAAWKHGSDVTKIDGGKIYTKSITAAVGAIGDLAVDTLQIAGEAVTGMTATKNDGFASGDVVSATYTVTSDSRNVVILCSCVWKKDNVAASLLRVYRDSTIIYQSSPDEFMNTYPHHSFAAILVDTDASAGSHTYKINVVNNNISSAYNSMVVWEVKK